MKTSGPGNRQKGVTLGEMMTTVAIIGVIAAIAIPNFIRVKDTVDFERVKANLKNMHQGLSDFLNDTGAFPSSLSGLGNSSEEQTITGSLTAIDQIGFDTVYGLGDGGFKAVAKPRGGTINKCLAVDILGLTDDWDCDSSIGFSIQPNGGFAGAGDLTFLNDPEITDQQKLEGFTAHLEWQALTGIQHEALVLSQIESGQSTELPFVGYEPNKMLGKYLDMSDQTQAYFDVHKNVIFQKLRTVGLDLISEKQFSAQVAYYQYLDASGNEVPKYSAGANGQITPGVTVSRHLVGTSDLKNRSIELLGNRIAELNDAQRELREYGIWAGDDLYE